MRYKIEVTDTETGEVSTAEIGQNEIYFVMSGTAHIDSVNAYQNGTVQVTFKDVDPRSYLP